MNIAAVISDIQLYHAAAQYFDRYQIESDLDFTVRYYTSCEALYRELQTGAVFDLMFLEIELPNMRGTEFASLLRKKLHDYTTQIVFVSATAEYAVKLFPIRPIDYLVKPVTYQRFCACLNNCINDPAQGSSFVTYTLENTQRKTRVSELLYLKTYGKKVELHVRDGCFSVYGKISELIAGCESNFLCVSRGEYANIQHIIAVAPQEVRLTGNHILHISRGRLHAVHQRLAQI